MRVPIRILVGELPGLSQGETWGDVISNWESYALEWNASSNLTVDPNEAPVLDMFGDEGISIKSMVKDLSDPKKLFTDFSRSFTVPASKKNNRIFKHYYNIDVVNGLDSRELIPAKILMNNTTYKIGNMRLDSVKISKGVAMSYKVVFLGKLSELARKIGSDKLSYLDWSDYNNESFNFASEMANTTNRDLVFPVSSKRDRLLADSGTASLGVENARNIAYIPSAPLAEDYGLREADITGAFRVGAILDKIADTYGFTFSGAFDFEYLRELRLWLHKTDQTSSTSAIYNFGSIAYTSSPINYVTPSNTVIYFNATSMPTIPDQAFHKWELDIKANFTGNTTIKALINNDVVGEITTSGGDYSTMTSWMTKNFKVIRFEVDSDTTQSITLNIRIRPSYKQREQYSGSFGGTYFRWSTVYVPSGVLTGTANVGTASTYSVANNMPPIKIVDFLSLLFKRFNLIAEVDEDLDIKGTHFDAFLSNGETKDITEYVEADAYDIARPNLYSSLVMKGSESKTALEIGYEKVNSKQYGEINYTLTGDTGVRLSGQEYAIKLKSQMIPLEPLNDLNTGNDFKLAYTLFSDLQGTEQSIDPCFTYVHKDTISYGFPDIALRQVAGNSGINTYFQPTNNYTLNNSISLGAFDILGNYFGNETNELLPSVGMMGIGLWNSFYRGITSLMFSESKRNAKYTAHIPQSVLIDLKLSDVLIINNRHHRINSIETNYLTGISKLDLTMLLNSNVNELVIETLEITNNHATDATTITWLDYSSGKIEAHFLFQGANTTITAVGGIIGQQRNADLSIVAV